MSEPRDQWELDTDAQGEGYDSHADMIAAQRKARAEARAEYELDRHLERDAEERP